MYFGHVATQQSIANTRNLHLKTIVVAPTPEIEAELKRTIVPNLHVMSMQWDTTLDVSALDLKIFHEGWDLNNSDRIQLVTPKDTPLLMNKRVNWLERTVLVLLDDLLRFTTTNAMDFIERTNRLARIISAQA